MQCDVAVPTSLSNGFISPRESHALYFEEDPLTIFGGGLTDNFQSETEPNALVQLGDRADRRAEVCCSVFFVEPGILESFEDIKRIILHPGTYAMLVLSRQAVIFAVLKFRHRLLWLLRCDPEYPVLERSCPDDDFQVLDFGLPVIHTITSS